MLLSRKFLAAIFGCNKNMEKPLFPKYCICTFIIVLKQTKRGGPFLYCTQWDNSRIFLAKFVGPAQQLWHELSKSELLYIGI